MIQNDYSVLGGCLKKKKAAHREPLQLNQWEEFPEKGALRFAAGPDSRVPAAASGGSMTRISPGYEKGIASVFQV